MQLPLDSFRSGDLREQRPRSAGKLGPGFAKGELGAHRWLWSGGVDARPSARQD